MQVHENEKMHCKDKGVHMKEKAGKENEGKMVVHKELDAFKLWSWIRHRCMLLRRHQILRL